MDETDLPFGIPSPDDVGAVEFERAGKPDAHNRYPSAVMVYAQFPAGASRLRECSGVLVAPHLVLTAGHCVCRRRDVTALDGAVEYRMDAASCAETATVTVFFYEQDPHDPQQIRGATFARHSGRVRPHPGLEVRFDTRQAVLKSHADLAAILLDEPVPGGFRPAIVSKTPALPGETVVRVGFGYDTTLGALDGRRLVLESKVLRALAPTNGRFLLESSDGYLFRGDDGGPCFRETPSGPMLVGISTTGLGQELTMTSLLPYWDWLREELSVAASTSRPTAPGASE